MGIEKAEIKIGLAKDLGRKYAEMAKALDVTLHKIDGEQEGYKKATLSLKSIYQRVDDDLDAGRFEGLGPLEIAKVVKTAITQVGGCLDNLTEEARASKFKTQGRLDGLVKAIEVVQKVADSEQGKISALVAALEEADLSSSEGSTAQGPSRRPVGHRPSASIAAQRKAENLEPLPQKGIRTGRGAPSVLKSGGTKQAVPPKKASKKASKKSPKKM